MEDTTFLLLLGGAAAIGGGYYLFNKKNKEKEKLQKEKEELEKKLKQSGQTVLTSLKAAPSTSSTSTANTSQPMSTLYAASKDVANASTEQMKKNGFWSDVYVLEYLTNKMSQYGNDCPAPMYIYWVSSAPWSMSGGFTRSQELFGQSVSSSSSREQKILFLRFFNAMRVEMGFNDEGQVVSSPGAGTAWQESAIVDHPDSSFELAFSIITKLSSDDYIPFAYKAEAYNINKLIEMINPLVSISAANWEDFWKKKGNDWKALTATTSDETVVGFLDLVDKYNRGV